MTDLEEYKNPVYSVEQDRSYCMAYLAASNLPHEWKVVAASTINAFIDLDTGFRVLSVNIHEKASIMKIELARNVLYPSMKMFKVYLMVGYDYLSISPDQFLIRIITDSYSLASCVPELVILGNTSQEDITKWLLRNIPAHTAPGAE